MRLLHNWVGYRQVARAFASFALLATSLAGYGATVTGTVTNKTSDKPAANDDVVLLALTQDMQEISRTKTDAAGHYTLNLPDAGNHLVRVDHQKTAYYVAVAPGGTKADVNVYDVSTAVKGLTTEAVMLRADTDGQELHVIETHFVKNDSSPAKTQFGPHAYDIYLPPDAQIEASIAMGPGGMPVSLRPVPSNEKGRYSFVFPVRPGETRFQVSYHVAYSGSLALQARFSLPTANFAVVLPKSMTLRSERNALFEPIAGDSGTQNMLAKNVSPSQTLAFTISGTGSLPNTDASASGQTAGDQGADGQGSNTPASAADNRPGGGMAAPIDTPDPLDKYKWWILSGLAVAFAIAGGLFLQSGRSQTTSESSTAVSVSLSKPPSSDVWLVALKEQLFALETERLEGRINGAEYSEQKAAVEVMLKRALQKKA